MGASLQREQCLPDREVREVKQAVCESPRKQPEQERTKFDYSRTCALGLACRRVGAIVGDDDLEQAVGIFQ